MGRRPTPSWQALVAAGACTLIAVRALHIAVDGRRLFDTEPWDPDEVRVALPLGTAATVAVGLGALRLVERPMVLADSGGDRLRMLALAMSVVHMLVVVVSPAAFDVLSREDRPGGSFTRIDEAT